MALYNKPIKKEKLERARALRMKEKQMSAIIREIFLHFLVVIIVLFVAYGNHDDKSFSYSKRAIDILTKGIPAFTKVRIFILLFFLCCELSQVFIISNL